MGQEYNLQAKLMAKNTTYTSFQKEKEKKLQQILHGDPSKPVAPQKHPDSHFLCLYD